MKKKERDTKVKRAVSFLMAIVMLISLMSFMGTEGFAASDDCKIISVRYPLDATLTSSNVAIRVAPAATSVFVDVLVSPGATWKLYKDSRLNEVIPDCTVRDLNFGSNVAYIQITSADGNNSKTYSVDIQRSENTSTYIKQINYPENALIAGNFIYAEVPNDTSFITFDAYVSVGDTWLLYQDSECLIPVGRGIGLAEGMNVFYLKVYSSTLGTYRIYTCNIVRKTDKADAYGPGNLPLYLTRGSRGNMKIAISDIQLQQMIMNTPFKSDGSKDIVVDMSNVSYKDASYVTLPGSFFRQYGNYTMTFKTPYGIVKLHEQTTQLSVTDQFDFSLTSDHIIDMSINSVTAGQSELGHSFILGLPYQLQDGQDPSSVYGLMVNSSGRRTIYPISEYKDGYLYVASRLTGQFDIESKVNEFSDTVGKWSEAPVKFMASRNVILGVGDNQFAPDANIKRCDYVLMLLRAFNQNTSNFTGPYYTSGWNLAKELGIMKDIPDEPEGLITREEMFAITQKMLYRMGYYSETPSYAWLNVFSDKDNVSAFAMDGICILKAHNLIYGADNNMLYPQNNSKRSEAAQFLYNITNAIIGN
ncbi:MAG: S-layer homology domain-containing protein [Bacillota bacterium]|nr:S-layer homology domain-containing protein [Bacillota bacterium]